MSLTSIDREPGRATSDDAVRSITLMGGFSVYVHGKALVLPTRKAAALLAILAFRRGREIRREALMVEMWPDVCEESARTSLRQALVMVRKLLEAAGLGCEALSSTRQTIALEETAFRTDVVEFEGFVAAADQCEGDDRLDKLRQANEAYGGSLLPGFDEAWIMTERLRLEASFVGCSVELAEILSDRSRHAEALPYALRAVEADKYSEAARIAVVRALLGLKRSPEARHQVGVFEAFLWDELGVEPSQATRSTFERWFAMIDAEPQPGLGSRPTLAGQRTRILGRRVRIWASVGMCALAVWLVYARSGSAPSHFGSMSPAPRTATYTDIGLGFRAIGVNASGTVVGISTLPGAPPFLWTPLDPNGTIGHLTPLSHLPGRLATASVAFNGINRFGTVVGLTEFSGLGVKNWSTATLWRNGKTTPIGLADGKSSDAHGLNDNGDVVGAADGAPKLWRNGATVDLPTLPDSISTLADDTNNMGQIVGHTIEGTQTLGGISFEIHRAVLWQGGVIHDIGVLPKFNRASAPNCINSRGMVVGNSYAVVNGVLVDHAFLWMPDSPNGTTGHMMDLGTLPGLGLESSSARGINASGQVVGYCFSHQPKFSSYFRAFVWDTVHGMRDLNALLPPGSGWELKVAWAINDSGQVVGEAHDSGNSLHGFLLTP